MSHCETHVLSSADLPPLSWAQNNNPDDPVPLYSELSTEGGWDAMLEIIANSGGYLETPILHYPPFYPPVEEHRPAYRISRNIVSSVFDAVQTGNTELITTLLHKGLISPDVTDKTGGTPLVAAVQAGHSNVVRALLQLGAEVNKYAEMYLGYKKVQRTALQIAAQNGNLVMVKVLMEEFGADDSLVAPDGQLALRLAADRGHREVVEYLPARRGGEFLRWKAHHERAVQRAVKAAKKIGYALKCIFWYLPKLLVWWIPKYVVVRPLYRTTKWAWKNRSKFSGWCKRQVAEFPRRAKSVATGAVEVARETPRIIRKIFKHLWKFLKRIPGVLRDIALAVWEGLKALGRVLASIANRTASLLHTVASAIVTFFRNITLQDIWNGVCDVLAAVLIKVPKAFWSFLKGFAKISYKVVGSLFGLFGKMVWGLVEVLLFLAQYIPNKLVEILVSLGSSFVKAGKEVRVWVNPKA